MIIFQLIQKPQLRGAEMFASQLSANLEKSGHTVFLISIFAGNADLPFAGTKLALNRPANKRFFDLQGWKQLAALIKQHQPDIIQANAADTLKFAVFSRLFTGWKTPIVYRNASKMSLYIKSRFQLLFNKFLVDKTDYVISVSHNCEVDFRETFSFPADKIDTVQIGVDNKAIGDLPADLQHVFGAGPVLVHVGGFVFEKNHKGLINVFAGLAKNNADAKLLLVGTGKLEDEVKAQINALGLTNRVYFAGRRNDVLEIVKASDVFVMSSIMEGLPAVLIEAMYCKTPVVAFNVGGIGEVVKHHETGWLINSSDEQAMIDAITEVLAAAEQTATIVERAYNVVSTRFMNENIAARFAAIYKSIGNGKN